MPETSNYYSHGKILLSGEYLVLDGAMALGLPTRQGQRLEVIPTQDGTLHFRSLDEKDRLWFEARYDLDLLKAFDPAHGLEASAVIRETNNPAVAESLLTMLESILLQNPQLISGSAGMDLTSRLEFPRDWGLGSSSTFINNLAQWSETDPYTILRASLGGSGYDIACAGSDTPLFYTRTGEEPLVERVAFNPSFKDQLYFIHLNKKQNSREGIQRYRNLPDIPREEIENTTQLSREFHQCNDPEEFGRLMDSHENLISTLLGLTTVKEALFSDFQGHLKSLGAWGGDFIMALSENDPKPYFNNKGYHTVLSYSDLIL